MKTYTIGEIELTQQALAVFIISLIGAIVTLIVLKSKPKVAAGAFVVFFGVGCYATYLTNCTVVGKCEKLAWFLVAINVLSAFIVLPMRYKMLMNNKR